MKTPMCFLAISLVIWIAIAQDAKQNEPKSPQQAGTQTQTATPAQPGSVRTAELQTRNYKGPLLDASCTMSDVSKRAL